MRVPSSVWLFLTVAPVLTLPGQVAAQGPATAVAELRLGHQVRLEAPGAFVEGATVMAIDGGSLVVADAGQEWIIETRGIHRLEVRKRAVVRNAIKYALAGVVVGFGTDKFLGKHVFVGGEFEGDPTSDGVGRGALVGAAFGIVYGLTHWRWSVVFPR